MLTIDRTALDALAALLLDRAGLKVAPDSYHALRLAMQTRMPALGVSDAARYVGRLKEPSGDEELRALLPLVTVGKTEFFRDARQFQALERNVLPDLLARSRREQRKVQIWSAGCATGEEPYSLAVVLAELGASFLEATIIATDVNLAAVEHASQGRYIRRRMIGMTDDRLERFFHQDGEVWEAKPELKRFIDFKGHNLASPGTAHVPEGGLDLILCRNVIIYFDLPTIQRLMDKFLDSLRPHGHLFLGYSESLFKVYDKFEMVEVEGAFVYRKGTNRKRDHHGAGKPHPPAPVPHRSTPPAHAPRAAAPAPSPAPPRTTAKPASAQQTPPRAPVATPVAPAPAPRQSPTVRLDAIAYQMNQGDFVPALEAVRRLSEEEPNDLDALLTLGNLESLLGHASESRAAFDLALSREPICVEARVFGGIASFQAGAFAEAKSEFMRALFLEPTLAIGHYLLAQCHERSGDLVAARRAYRNAITQLKFPQRPLAGHYPDMIDSADAMARAARYALAALEEA